MKKYIALSDMMHTNCSVVLDIIRKNGAVSRKEITTLSGLSWGGMTKIVDRLILGGYIIETKEAHGKKSGRTPSLLRINTEKNFVLGLDINRTGLRGVVMNLCGTVLEVYSAPSEEDMLPAIFRLTDRIFKAYPDCITGIGVAMQGIVKAAEGISVRLPGAEDWKNVPLADMLSSRYGVPALLGHDPDCMLLSHLSPEETENKLLFRLDKSAGMAVSIGGNLLQGNGILEIAHFITVPDGKKCSCGLSGCIEAYLMPCIQKDGSADKTALSALSFPLAVLLQNFATVFCAHTVILTGDLMRHSALFEAELTKCLASLGFSAKLKISDGDTLAARGAAHLAVQNAISALSL